MNTLLLFITLAGSTMGCGKKSVNPPPVDTTTTVVIKDPAQYGTPFAGVPATKDIVMYEVNMQTYTPANFNGVTARLDSIKALGINTIWLMPIYPIGVLKAVGSPYAVKDYKGINANFGSLDDLRNLVAQAHNRNMAVILDWVADHTSWDNTWINNKSWYKQDGAGNVIIPPGTNYQDVAALNYNNSDMRSAMIKAMKYWVFTANVDGFRCDYADPVPTDFWKQALDTLSNIKTHKLIYLAEGTAGSEITAGFQLSYAFSFYGTLKGVFSGSQTPGALFAANSAEIASLPSNGIKLRYSTNHDVASSDGSVLNIYHSKQGSLAAFVLASYIGGVPLVYDSQEVGYPNNLSFFTNVAVDYTANKDMVAAYKKILAFRSAHEAVKTGAITNYSSSDMVAFEKIAGADDVLVLVNIRNSNTAYTIPTALQNTIWTNGVTGDIITLTSVYNLPAYGYLILKKN